MTHLRPASWADKVLLQEEMRKLELRGYSFQGQTDAERLGADRWILEIGVVEERSKQKKAQPAPKLTR